MDTKVENAVIVERNIGNLPADAVTFYDAGKKPTIATADNLRVSFLGFKTDKKTNTKRENMAVVVPRLDSDEFSGVSGHKLLCDLLAEQQDEFLKMIADKEIPYSVAINVEEFTKAYNDNSRTSSGRKVTKESMSKFFMDHFAPIVVTRALTKNAQMTDETVAKVVEGYKGMFCNFTKYNILNAFTPAQFGLMQQIISAGRVTVTDESDAELLEYVDAKIAKVIELRTVQDALTEAI
jgi:hypothetical protein